MTIRLILLGCFTIIALLAPATTCDAGELGPELKIRSDVRSLPVTATTLTDGDAIDFEISHDASVSLAKEDRPHFYFKIIKNGRHIDTIYPTSKHQKAMILHGNYSFQVYSVYNDELVSTVTVHTKAEPLSKTLIGTLIIIIIAVVGAGLIALVIRIRRELAIRRHRRRNPPVWRIDSIR